MDEGVEVNECATGREESQGKNQACLFEQANQPPAA